MRKIYLPTMSYFVNTGEKNLFVQLKSRKISLKVSDISCHQLSVKALLKRHSQEAIRKMKSE